MKLLRLRDLPDTRSGHFLSSALPGEFLCMGGLGFRPPGFRSHAADGPSGTDRHVHESQPEGFVVLQGKATMEVDGTPCPLQTGDVCIVEPGEDHHIVSDTHDPCVYLWLHAGPQRHRDQQ
jgi:mannose-6-phosphate isomerase-like protein (cupin superfamily)